MGLANKVIANTSIMAFGRFIGKIIGFFTTIILARYLGVELFGQYSLVLSFIAIFLFLNDFGVAYYVVREISRDKEKTSELLGNAFSLKIVFSLFAILATNAAAMLAGYTPQMLFLIAIFSITHLSGSLSSLFSIVFQSNLKLHYNVIVETLQAVLLFSVVGIFAAGGGSLTQILVFYAASTFVVTVAGYFFARKFASFKPRFDYGIWKKLFSSSWPFALNTVFTAVYTRIDVVILSILATQTAIGLYSASFRFTEALAFIPLGLLITLYPIMSMYSKESVESLKKTTLIAMKFLVVLFVPIVAGTFLLAPRILAVVYGSDFFEKSSIESLQALTFASLFIFLNYLNINVLNSINREKSVLKTIFTGIVINVLLNLLLIPTMGILGAAIATLAAEIIIFFIYYFTIKKNFFALDLKVFLKPVLSALAMSAFALFLFELNLFVLVFLSALFYFTVLFVIKGFSKEDVALVKKIFLRS